MDESLAFERLRLSVSRWAELDGEEWALLRGIFRYRTVARNESILKPGGSSRELFFVASGLLRYFYLDEAGAEANKEFVYESMFTAPTGACSPDGLKACGIDALEPSSVLVAQAPDFQALFGKSAVFERLGRNHAEWWLALREGRARNFQLRKAADRYLEFLRLHGDLAQRIPQYHIASYLGITDVSLSRIRRGLSRRNAVSPAISGRT